MGQIPHLFINVNVTTYEVQDEEQKKKKLQKEDV